VDLVRPNQNITFKVGATNFELQRAIEAALPAAVAQTKDLAKRFKGSTEKQSCEKIFNFLLNDIQYKVDGNNQKIKLPSAFMREKSGDCKSYSLFTGAILSNLKIPFNFTYASYNPTDKTPEHIYVTTKSGCIIDAVYGKFNAEKKPTYKFQKPMNISYISGIKEMRSEKNSKIVNNYNSIGNIFSQTNPSLSGFQGLGRTGLDWGNAVGRSFTAGEKAEYLSKNIALAPARALLTSFISNNGGGIANFLYSMWLRESAYELPNNKKYEQEYAAKSQIIISKYKVPVFTFPADAVKRYQDAAAAYQLKNPNATTLPFKMADYLTSVQKAQYDLSKKSATEIIALYKPELDALRKELDKKYPISSRYLPVANTSSQAKYRAIEWRWFWSLGGSPDDLNQAVKEGNGKSPRGKDANYMLNKAFNGGLSAKDIPLIIRAFVSAQAGDKFGLGDDGTYLLAINGTNRIGLDPVTTTTTTTTAATITAYSAAIIPILTFVMSEVRKWRAEEGGLSQNPIPNPLPPIENDLLSGNTGILLLGAAVVGVYLYTK
jgi:hypothetical protein